MYVLILTKYLQVYLFLPSDTFFVGMSPAASSTNFTGPLGLGHHLRMLEVPQINLSGHSLSDTCLHQMTKILAHIHRKFYEALDESCAASTSKTAMETTFNEKMSTVDSLPPNIHVQKYITRARQSVLHGVKLYLHGSVLLKLSFAFLPHISYKQCRQRTT